MEAVKKFFKLEERGTTVMTEFRGGLATFLSMAYILAVNPRILADSGGPCDPADYGDSIFSPGYEECMEDVKRQMITATALVSIFGTLLMGLTANLPIALSTGMGMNAYFTYDVVGWRGGGDIAYSQAMSAVAVEGAIFFILAITGARGAIVKLIPEPVRYATPAGIGFFLAHLGLQTAEGIGVVVGDIATAVTLGGCPLENRTPMVAYDDACANLGICVTSDNYTCDVEKGKMTGATTWIGIVGGLLMVILMAYRVKSAFIVGIVFVTVISWFKGTDVSYFEDDVYDIGGSGESRYEYFKQVVKIEPLDMITGEYSSDFGGVATALFTFLYVDFLDTSGTLFGLANQMDLVDEDGNFEGSTAAFSSDALATIFASIFGMSPVTSYIESAAGVEAGARTGLSSVFVAFFFFLSIFFAPILASIPPWASGSALILAGACMCKSLLKVNWYDPVDGAAAMLTLIVMPLTYSIAYGLIAGLGSYIICHSVFFVVEKVFKIEKPTFGPPEEMEEAAPVKEVDEPEPEPVKVGDAVEEAA